MDTMYNDVLGVLQYMLVLRELHREGYGKLRWVSGYAPTGMSMRCFITTRDNVRWMRRIVDDDDKSTWCTSTNGEDSGVRDVKPYIAHFKEVMGAFLDKSKGEDREYTTWFEGLVDKALEGNMPVYFEDSYEVMPLGMLRIGKEMIAGPWFSEVDMEQQLTVTVGDITKLSVAAIVNAANSRLLGGGGVDGAIHKAAGPELLAECRTLGGCPTGESKMTDAYHLPCQKVIHTVGPRWSGGQRHEDELLASCYRTAFDIAATNGLVSVAFPCISTGVYGFPRERAAVIALGVIEEYIRSKKYRGYVTLCCFSEDDAELYRRMLGRKGWLEC